MSGPYWRKEPLTKLERELLKVVYKAHQDSVERQNISSVTAQNVAAGSMSYTNAIAAAVLSIGNGIHAPLEFTIQLLNEPEPVKEAHRILDEGCKIPGWGNSFVKGQPDPIWAEVNKAINGLAPALWWSINGITRTLHARGKKIFPNPSTYTAATAIILRIPPKLAPSLFVMGRLAGWSKLIAPFLR